MKQIRRKSPTKGNSRDDGLTSGREYIGSDSGFCHHHHVSFHYRGSRRRTQALPQTQQPPSLPVIAAQDQGSLGTRASCFVMDATHAIDRPSLREITDELLHRHSMEEEETWTRSEAWVPDESTKTATWDERGRRAAVGERRGCPTQVGSTENHTVNTRTSIRVPPLSLGLPFLCSSSSSCAVPLAHS